MATNANVNKGTSSAEALDEALRATLSQRQGKLVSPESRQKLFAALMDLKVKWREINTRLDATDKYHKADVKPFRLLDLPAELRNRIYEFVVADLWKYDFNGSDTFFKRGKYFIPGVCSHYTEYYAKQPAVTKVNRQIREESLSVFYGSNVLEAHIHRCDFVFFFEWMHKIGHENRKRLRKVQLTLFGRWTCGDGLLDFVRWYALTPFLEHIEFQINVHVWNEIFLRFRTPEDVTNNVMPMESTVSMLKGAIRVGKLLQETGKSSGKISEGRIRYEWEDWLQLSGKHCADEDCGAGLRGSENAPEEFTGRCTMKHSRVRFDDELHPGCGANGKEYWSEKLHREMNGDDEEGCEACGCTCGC